MKIAVMGAGALGGYFGGRLAEAGRDVSLIARGAHLAALRERGLRIVSPRGDAEITGIHATDDPAEVGPADIILFMVKNYDVEAAAAAIGPMLTPDTMVVTCQNGVTAPDRLARAIGAERVVPGVARIPGEVSEPGLITHTAEFDTLAFGETDGARTARVERLRALLEEAGTRPQVPENIVHDLWLKFISQSVVAPMTSLLRTNMGPIRETPETAALFDAAMQETAAVGHAEVPGLPADILDRARDWVPRLPRTMHASMRDDLERGKPIESEYFSGDVVRLGAKHGIPTPVHAVFHAALKPFTHGPAN